MPWLLRLSIALRQTFDPGHGLSGFLSRISILGMALAIALLLTVLSVMNGFDREMRDRILALVPHVLIQSSGTHREWIEIQSSILKEPDVDSVSRFIAADALLMRGSSVDTVRLTGLAGESLHSYSDVISQPLENWHRDSLVLGQSLAARIGLEIGDMVTFIIPETRDPNLTGFKPIRARLNALLQSGTELDETLVLVHIDVVEPFTSNEGVIEGLAIHLKDVFSAQSFRWQISQLLPVGFWASDWRSTYGNLYAAIQLSRDLIGFVLFSVILVAAFNVISSLMLVVTDRRKMIAMLMTIGAQKGDLVAIFFIQGAVIGAIGTSLGVFLGAVMACSAPQIALLIESLLGYPLLQTDVYPLAFVPVDIRLEDFLATSVISILLSIGAAVLPARRAGSLLIAETLAH